jgi:transcriptional regulator with XRE-family HTH domain
MMKIEMIVEKTRTGYSAYATKGMTFTVGKDLDELKKNILEVVNLSLEDQGKSVTLNDIKISLDLPQFFSYYNVINAKALSERIGMNQSLLAQYIKGNKKPSAAQKKRILNGVHQVGRELAAIKSLL